MKPRCDQHGLTLVEMLAVVAVLAIVVTLVAPEFGRFLQRRRLDASAASLATDLRYTRSEAVARNEPVRWSWARSSTGACYVIHTGPGSACTCQPGGPTTCEDGAEEVKTVTFPTESGVRLEANVSSIAFDPTLGTATPGGTLRLSNEHGSTVQHVVNMLGRVRSCAVLGSMPGYARC